MADTQDTNRKRETRGEASSQGDRSRSQAAESERPRSKAPKRKVLGGALVFLILALYFVWIGNEMGSHAVSGTFEMWAIFGAIFLGVVALIAGGASMRRGGSR